MSSGHEEPGEVQPMIAPEITGETGRAEPVAVGPGDAGASRDVDASRVLDTSRPPDGEDASLLALVDRLTGVLERSDLGELEMSSGGDHDHPARPLRHRATGPGARRRRGGTAPPPGPRDRSPRGVAVAPGRTSRPAVGQGTAHRDLLRCAVSGCNRLRGRRGPRRGRPDHRPHRGDEAVQRDQERPRRSRRPHLRGQRRARQGEAGPDRGGARMTAPAIPRRPPHRLGALRPGAGPDQRGPRADGRHLRRVDREPHRDPRAARRGRPRDDRVDGRRSPACEPSGRPASSRTTST